MTVMWANYFKPETQHSGAKLVAQEKVSLSGGSDTAVDAYVRVAPTVKVHLASDIDDATISASCSCPASKKGQFCKHLWAVLLCAGEKYPDFFIGKKNLTKAALAPDPHAEKKEAHAAAAKLRASEHRKAEYQKQKLRAKAQAGGRKAREREAKTYPADVEAALVYFTLNGFPMPEGLSEAGVGEAKRKLSRVFHPDKGGNHDEVVELNRNWEVIIRFLRG